MLPWAIYINRLHMFRQNSGIIFNDLFSLSLFIHQFLYVLLASW